MGLRGAFDPPKKQALTTLIRCLQRPGEEGLVTITAVEPNRRLAWHDVQQRFTATVDLEGDTGQTRARVTVEAPWWSLLVEGLRLAPQEALSRLHALCQTAAGLY